MNKIVKKFTLGLLGVLFLVPFVQAADDTKYYSSLVYTLQVREKFDLFVSPEARFSDNSSSMFYYHLRTGLSFHVSPKLDVNVVYRYKESKSPADKWIHEDRMEFDLVPKFKIKKISVAVRNKFEVRDLGDTNKIVYRGFPKVMKKVSFGKLYAGDEVFYRFDEQEIFQNWVVLGSVTPIKKFGINLDVYYIYETVRKAVGSSDWKTAHIIGTRVKF